MAPLRSRVMRRVRFNSEELKLKDQVKWSVVKYSTVDGKKGGKVHQGKVKFLLHHHPKMFQQEYLTELPCGYLVCHAFYPPSSPLA